MTSEILKGCPSTSGDDFQLNTISIIKYAASVHPEVEVASRSHDGTVFRYNYDLAYRRIRQLANALTRMGVNPGDRIGVMEWNSHRHFELYLAISGIGAVVLQMNIRLSPKDLSHVVNHSRARFIFVGESLTPLLEAVAPMIETVEGYIILSDTSEERIDTSLASIGGYEELLSSERPAFDWPMIDETSAYSACYTSGTTGKPKGVYYSHRCIYLHTLSIAMSTQLSLNDVVMQTVPMFHAQGWGVWLAAPMVGAKLVFPGPYTIETTGIIVDLMISEGVTFNCGAPAIFMPMLDYIGSLPEKPDFAGLRLISGATEPPLSMMKGYWDVGRVNVLHAYGSTETTPLVLLNRFKPGIKGWSDEQKWENQKKQGLLISGVEMKIVDAEGKEVPHDGQSVGEILFRGPWITRKYHEDERSEGGFVDGYWKSGDAGTIDEHGYVKVTDRIKDVIKSGGEWISSIDMENLIMSHHNVREASVVGIAHPKWQERPLALVVLREKAVETRTAGEIMALLGQTFAKWQLPDKIIFLDDIPKTSVGKFDKKAIRSVYKDHYLQE